MIIDVFIIVVLVIGYFGKKNLFEYVEIIFKSKIYCLFRLRDNCNFLEFVIIYK